MGLMRSDRSVPCIRKLTRLKLLEQTLIRFICTVGIAKGYVKDHRGSVPGGDAILPHSKRCRPALGPTHDSIQWEPMVLPYEGEEAGT
jgi:hypothetical protein